MVAVASEMSGIPNAQAEPQKRTDELANEFAVTNGDYYSSAFARLGEARNYAFTFNWSAAIFGPLWLAGRSLWGMFWPFLLAETIAFVQMARGIWGDLGAEEMARVERLTQRAAQRFAEAKQAFATGAENAAALERSAEGFQRGAVRAQEAADAAVAVGPQLVLLGLVLLLIVKFLEGATANWALEKRFMHWRSDRSMQHGLNRVGIAGGIVMMLLVYPVTMYRFTAGEPAEWLATFPAEKSWHTAASDRTDAVIEQLTVRGDAFFGSVRAAIKSLLDGLEILLVGTPWPVVMLVIVVLAWRLAGVRVAIFTIGALAYLALLGFWEKSMATVALLGAAAFICIAVGIPLGVWCAKQRTVYSFVRPVLDFMQTMPAFVYLIPVIAFFGTGKPPGIIATIIFGMPPVVRLTVLGLQGVPHSVREAAMAFGASKRFLLLKVDLPLAMPSIMAGINQTILMCLSMVVIASLIGAKGLGEDVLIALQYAAEGQGLVAGLAILFCAMVLDRIVQGKGAKHSAAQH